VGNLGVNNEQLKTGNCKTNFDNLRLKTAAIQKYAFVNLAEQRS
jgi:hypothetical protein